MKMIRLSNSHISVTMSEPVGDDAYYQGTRFDRSGAFVSIDSSLPAGGSGHDGGADTTGLPAGGSGHEGDVATSRQEPAFCGCWFDDDTRTRHDHICGCPEEFGAIPVVNGQLVPVVGYNSIKEEFSEYTELLKPGVGIITKDPGEKYDRFKLYPIKDGGKWNTEIFESKLRFTHLIPGFYEYTKEIVLTESGFDIRHRLTNLNAGTLITDCYDHNFFTLGRQQIDTDREIDYAFPITADWRSDTVSAFTAGNGIRFSRAISQGEKAWINFPATGSREYKITIRGNGRSVTIKGDRPMVQSVFWSNHRVACPEPYIDIKAEPGQTMEWTIAYLFC